MRSLIISTYSLPAAILTITKLGNWATDKPVQERSVVYSVVTDAGLFNINFGQQLEISIYSSIVTLTRPRS